MSERYRRPVLWVAIALFLAVLVAVERTPAGDTNAYRQLQRFSEVLNRVQSDYVDDTEMEELIDAAIRGMLESLDPHTQFLDISQYRDLMTSTAGSFGGLGIHIAIRDGVLTVIAPIEGTPAARMGIQGGDQILYIEEESTEGFTADDAVNRLRGPEGTQVTIKIRREGVPDLIEYAITRDIIKLDSVPYTFVTDDRIGYMSVTQFSKSTSHEMESALRDLESSGIRGLVIDLRSNPGGLLDQAVEVSDLLLDDGQLITYTQGRRKNANSRFVDHKNTEHGGYPIVVLVNQYSASASEIVSGAVQDWDRGLVVGKTTFGKGSVQSVIPLDGETGLKLTTAKYYTPSGRCIHRPELASQRRLREIPQEGEENEEVYYTHAGRPVYGGGGITPDIEIEQRKMAPVEAAAERRGYFFNFAVEYFPYHTIEEGWTPDEETLRSFRDYLDQKEVEYTEEEWEESLEYVKNGIRREIYRKAFGDRAAFLVTVETDEQLQSTFDLFREAGTMDGLFALSESIRLQKEKEETVAGAAGDSSSSDGLTARREQGVDAE
ncbi:MAG: S41 family peptidase [Candidatus Eisenbacteria bacterium]|nr:S41 family peptidase [Candidatus Eisenbacteria bacterium]